MLILGSNYSVCAPVALLAAAAYIGISSPSRRVVTNLLSMIWELKNARSASAGRNSSVAAEQIS